MTSPKEKKRGEVLAPSLHDSRRADAADEQRSPTKPAPPNELLCGSGAILLGSQARPGCSIPHPLRSAPLRFFRIVVFGDRTEDLVALVHSPAPRGDAQACPVAQPAEPNSGDCRCSNQQCDHAFTSLRRLFWPGSIEFEIERTSTAPPKPHLKTAIGRLGRFFSGYFSQTMFLCAAPYCFRSAGPDSSDLHRRHKGRRAPV
jgi:hypothetical protein